MKSYVQYFVVIFFLVSCKAAPDSDRNYDNLTGKVYKLRFNPETGSKYYYEITNKSEMELEVNDKKTKTNSNSDIAVYYDIDRDSSGDFILNMKYDKIHLYSKKGEVEEDLKADNSTVALNPMEKMLIALKDTKVTAILSSTGEVKSVTGYGEVGDKIIDEMMAPDMEARNQAKKLWEQMIGERMIKKNMEELFKIFPDSGVHIGDTWRLTSKDASEINLIAKTTYTLKAINSDIALIKAEGIITDDKLSPNTVGFNNVSINLNGKQQCEYELETKTGMMISCNITGKVEGTIQMMGREVPVKIKTTVKINGRRMK